MATETKLTGLTINYLTQAQFDEALSDGTIDANQIYLTPDNSIVGITAGTGLSGGGTSGSITLNHSNSVTAQTTQAVYPIKIDAQGHISAYGNAVTIPSEYSLPLAADGTRGGVQIGYSESGTNYAVKLSSEKMYVSVPWTDTKVSTAAVTSSTTYYPIVGTNTTSAATKFYDSTGFTYQSRNGIAGDYSENGHSLLSLGNNQTASSSKRGVLRLYGSNTSAYYTDLMSGAPTANRTITFPNATGTVALTSDIPSVPTTATNNTTGILIADHDTTSVGSASGWSAGTASTWAFTGVTVANSISGAVDGSDSTQLNITLGTTTVQSKSSGSNSTVPSLTITSTTVVNGKSHSITDNGHTHTLS